MDWRDDRVGSALRGENPTVLAELSSGFAVMEDVQFLPGYCVLLSRNPDVQALAELPREERVQFLADVDLLATAVERSCTRTCGRGTSGIRLSSCGSRCGFMAARTGLTRLRRSVRSTKNYARKFGGR